MRKSSVVQEGTDRSADGGETREFRTVAPWGSPPTPLLPRWFRDVLASVRIPTRLRRPYSPATTVGDLGQFWETRSAPLDKAHQMALITLVSGHRPPPDYVVVPQGFDRSFLEQCPLKRRTRNCLKRSGLLAGEAGITVGQLLSIPNFGIASLLDLMCIVEASLVHVPLTISASEAAGLNPRELSWSAAAAVMQPVLSAAAKFCGAETLGDAFRRNLSQIASTLGLTPKFDAIRIQDLTGGQRITEDFVGRIAALQVNMSTAERLILEERLLSPSRKTLAQLSAMVGVTRERIRQIEQRLAATIESDIGSLLSVIVGLARQQLGPVVPAKDFDGWIGELFENSDHRHAAVLADRLLRSQLDYSCDSVTCLDGEAMSIVERLRKVASSVADDVGLIDETKLRAQLPGEKWAQHWPALLERCKFNQLTGRLAIRDTAKARVKAGLLNIGHPATREEVAQLCGIDSKRIGAKLSAIPGVIRADKNRWGLAEWIDAEYGGIPSEIMQRIHEDGGATTLDRILVELPRRFGVSESSVRAYVSSSQFKLRDGSVSLADASAIRLRDLDDVIDGRDGGAPYWTFRVEERYFSGYSLTQFPPELARELGCEPNGSTRVRIVRPSRCEDLSVIWRLSSLGGASLGYLADPLRRLAVSAGDRVRVVIRASDVVEFCRDIETELSDDNSDGRADVFLDRIKNRRRVL